MAWLATLWMRVQGCWTRNDWSGCPQGLDWTRVESVARMSGISDRLDGWAMDALLDMEGAALKVLVRRWQAAQPKTGGRT